MRILVTGARAPIAADIARSLSLAGHQVWTTDSLRFPVGRFGAGIQGYIRLPAPARDLQCFREALGHTCQRLGISLVVPTSEEVFWLAQARPRGSRVLAPDLETLAQVHHKGRFATLANELGHGAGESHVLHRPDELDAFLAAHDPERWVFKQVYSRFAAKVFVGPTRQALAGLPFVDDNPWLAQPLVSGQEVCVYNIVHEGRLLLHTAYLPRWRAGAGASVYFEPVSDPALAQMSERFAGATSFSGQMSFDVIRSAGKLVAIECNPRGTSGAHLTAQHPLCLAEALCGKAVQLPQVRPAMLGLALASYHPTLLARPEGWQAWSRAKDAMRQAGVPAWAQVLATAEVVARSRKEGLPLLEATTADIEWNGQGA